MKWAPVLISQFQLGLPLRYDVFSENGDLLACSSETFSQALKAKWNELGLSEVYIRLSKAEEYDQLLQPYDPAVLKRFEGKMEVSAEMVFEMATRMNDKRIFTSHEFQEITTQLLDDIRKDSAAALLVLFNSNLKEHSEANQQIADRSAQLSLLSMIIAREAGMHEQDCLIASTAALLHDISLMDFDFKADADDQQEAYRQHPLRSASIVESIAGINPKVAATVAQVHEDGQGSGFPRCLGPSRIIPIAKMINLADTYITLTSHAQPPMFPIARKLHPADAIGYVMYHAARGRFEVDTVRALIRATSLYPIGSTVELTDETTAVVFRSTNITPTKPIVRLNSTNSLLDLRESDISIRGPLRSDGRYNLLRKSQLGDVYWG